MIIKEFIEQRLKQNGKITVYDTDNNPMVLRKVYHIYRSDPMPELEFEMDCKALADYCRMTGLTTTNKN